MLYCTVELERREEAMLVDISYIHHPLTVITPLTGANTLQGLSLAPPSKRPLEPLALALA